METEFRYSVGLHVLIEKPSSHGYQPLGAESLTRALARDLRRRLEAANVKHAAVEPLGEFGALDGAIYLFRTDDPEAAIRALRAFLNDFGLVQFAQFGVFDRTDPGLGWKAHGTSHSNFAACFGEGLGIQEARAIKERHGIPQRVEARRRRNWLLKILKAVIRCATKVQKSLGVSRKDNGNGNT